MLAEPSRMFALQHSVIVLIKFKVSSPAIEKEVPPDSDCIITYSVDVLIPHIMLKILFINLEFKYSQFKNRSIHTFLKFVQRISNVFIWYLIKLNPNKHLLTMILKRLMMMPRFCFSEAAQTIEGNSLNMQDINLQLSPIHLPEDTQDLFLPQLLKVMLSKPSLMIWLTLEAFSENQQLLDRFSKTQQYAATNKNKFLNHLPPLTTAN